MKYYYSILFIALALFQQCDDSEVNVSGAIRLRIVDDQDISCGLPLVEFYRGADKVKEITGVESAFYIAHNLDSDLAIEDKEYKVAVRKTEDDELGPCLAIGPAYPWITIIAIEEIE